MVFSHNRALPGKDLTSNAPSACRLSRLRGAACAAISAVALLVASAAAAALPAFAQDFGGGVNMDGSWYAGEGLETGDYFAYTLCHVNYKDCTEFRMELWVEGEVEVGTETKWLVRTVVYDGPNVVKGSMELGQIAPEPSGGTTNLGPYRDAFKTSIVWLSAFATAHHDSKDGPKEFRAPSWGKIANIGGEQVKPTSLETVGTRAGEFESVLVTWKTGGRVSEIWVVDGFPFPVKASTWTHVSEGIPPQEYRFELLEHRKDVGADPFAGVTDTAEAKSLYGCPENYDFVKVRKSTNYFQYLIDLKYGPENPRAGCDIEWIINFHNKFDETEFLNQVHYDILVTDEHTVPVRSLAGDESRNFLFSASGQVRRFMPVMENPGTAHYTIIVYGMSPEHIVPSSSKPDYLTVDIEVAEAAEGAAGALGPGPDAATVSVASGPAVPEWIKTAAAFWVDGSVSDSEFASAIGFLIQRGVLEVPPVEMDGDPTAADPAGTGVSIPEWVKTSTDFWVHGFTTDSEFIAAIQFLMSKGIVSVG